MNHENQILDALLIASTRDLPDEMLPEAWADQTRLMSGVCLDELGETILN